MYCGRIHAVVESIVVACIERSLMYCGGIALMLLGIHKGPEFKGKQRMKTIVESDERYN